MFFCEMKYSKSHKNISKHAAIYAVDLIDNLWYNVPMIKCDETKDGYLFSLREVPLAMGVYEDDAFCLLHNNDVLPFGNAMQAFVHLRALYEPSVPSPKTMELFTKPARAIDNMSKWINNPVLDDMPKEVFHANIHS